jgi:hypothetical protein
LCSDSQARPNSQAMLDLTMHCVGWHRLGRDAWNLSVGKCAAVMEWHQRGATVVGSRPMVRTGHQPVGMVESGSEA